MDLRDKPIFITGCDTGIGRALALELSRKYSARVLAGCLTRTGGDALEKESQGRIRAINLDVTDEKSVENAYKEVCSLLQGGKLYGLVNNAGFSKGWFAEFTPLRDYEETMSVNYVGAVRVTLRFMPLLLESKGRVVTITSSLTLVSNAGVGAYTASKLALHGFVASLSLELEPFGVRFVEICPGATATPFLQSGLQSAYTNFEASDPSIQARYGGEKFVKKMKDLWGSSLIRLIQGNPAHVASVTALSLATQMPRRRYLVGTDAFLVWRVLGLLPTGVHEKLAKWSGITITPIKSRG